MNCKEGNIQIINQIHLLLNELSNDQYSKPLALFNGSTIGKHIRHIYDFYLTVIKSVSQSRLDYLDRKRDPFVETDVAHTKLLFEQLIKNVARLPDYKSIEIVTDFDPNSNADREVVSSSIGRELMYAYDHAVHHLAIIKMGLRVDFPQIKFDPHLGIAPSTIKYNNLISSNS